MSTQYESHMDVDNAQLSDSGGFDLMQKLPALLRILGTGALLVAMYTFLIKGWQNGSDVMRYLLMLGHTGVLAAIGLASGLWLKESKGARLLLSLALVSIPANFAILGAFIFSQFGIDANVHYPNFVAWSAGSEQSALVTTGVALLFLVPITWLGFSVLARSISKRLTVLFLISNAMLLLPIREPMVIGLIVLALSLMGIVFFHQSLQKHVATKTKEGITALTLQALPLAMLLGRTLWLYSADLFLLLVMVVAIFLFLRQLSSYLDKSSSVRKLLNLVSVIPAVSSMLISVLLFAKVDFIANALVLPLASLIAAVMIYDITQRENEYTGFYRWLAAAILAMGMFMNMSLHTGGLASLISIATGIGLLIMGYRNKQRGFFIIGLIMMIVGIVEQLYYLVHHFDLGSWASLAVLGVLAIVVGSVIEAKGEKIQHRFVKLKDNFRSWEG